MPLHPFLPQHLLHCEVILGVILLYGSLVHKYIFLGVIPIDETVSIPYIEPFYCSQNLCCEEDIIPAGGCH